MPELRGFATAGALMALIGALTTAPVAGQAAALTVHLDDQIRMPPDDMKLIKKHVEEIFHAAGVSVSWEGALQRPVSDLSCDGVRRVAVAIINIRQPFSNEARDSQDVMGRAAPGYARAWVFRNRIVDIARDRPVDINMVLARAIGHEIGHLLLPDARHGAAGIMRPSLNVDDSGAGRFTHHEAQLLRAAFAKSRRVAPMASDARCR